MIIDLARSEIDHRKRMITIAEILHYNRTISRIIKSGRIYRLVILGDL